MSLIELRDIRFAYPGHGEVLKGASMALGDGERLAVTGHNGAGKSTLLRMMVGLLKPSSGEVHAFGERRMTEVDFGPVRRGAGLVFQDPDDQLFCPTVAEDIAFGPLNLGQSRDEAMAQVEQVLTLLDLRYLRDRITHKLSGGEKRLVSLAAVLAMSPQVLLLDEPTNALDEENEERLVDILQSLPQAMVLISHDPHFRRKIATRELRMQDGVLVAPDGKCRHTSTGA
ncbi:ABC transporter ATP-binding protein [Alisedimentitalea sp. MJ-SS2]|uniref:energy-coupling factor ABC transporter ATP-binding protein n=1 Tax=Aliisedimentitalea sp. MJ-SS2 TaxID=3049795 RepID=UPI00290A40F7|nr:ABC transporter ATP-binding protein [Alisedimentitalea sp. MJ-SS2]MDU8927540.1 ABC transporter ATP-binding protein [Alisedimentitalea sp. MJ-SS2]